MKCNFCRIAIIFFLLLVISIHGFSADKLSSLKSRVDTGTVSKKSFDPLYKYLAKTIRYPRDARQKGAQGTVIIVFDITPEGTVANAGLVNAAEIRKASPGIYEELLRDIQGFQDTNKTLKAGSYEIPVTFKIIGLVAPPPIDPELKKRPNFLNEIVVSGYYSRQP